MTLDQRNLPFEEPPRDQIPGISAMHVAAMDTMDIDDVWVGAGMNQLILRTVGRKSGKEHRVALPYWIDGDGHRVVVASFAGAPQHPAWYLNLVANPDVTIERGAETYRARATTATEPERTRLYDQQAAAMPFFAAYPRQVTTRKIPVVVFEPVGSRRPVRGSAPTGSECLSDHRRADSSDRG